MMKPKKSLCLFCIGLVIFVFGALIGGFGTFRYLVSQCNTPKNYTQKKELWIQLYGESHGQKAFYEEELSQWQSHYAKGARKLFIEGGYCEGEWLNLYMQTADDTILQQLLKDWKGSAAYNSDYLQFFKNIRITCPQTVFYGTDIEHQWETTGMRYLEFLQKQGQQNSERYQRAQKCIEQGKYFYQHSKPLRWRTQRMVENFIETYNRIGKGLIVGIYGHYHTNMNNASEMAYRLRKVYGDHISCLQISNLLEEKKKAKPTP